MGQVSYGRGISHWQNLTKNQRTLKTYDTNILKSGTNGKRIIYSQQIIVHIINITGKDIAIIKDFILYSFILYIKVTLFLGQWQALFCNFF